MIFFTFHFVHIAYIKIHQTSVENSLDYHLCPAMFKVFRILHSKPQTILELTNALQQIWHDLPLSGATENARLENTGPSNMGW